MKKTSVNISRPMVIMVLVVATLMIARPGSAERATRACSVATLKGTYQFASAGFVVIQGATLPLTVAGIDILDGKGNLSSNSTLIVGGVVVFQNLLVPNGTYTVRKNCTGTLILSTVGVVLDIFVAPDGEAYDYVQTEPVGYTLAGTIRRVGKTETEQ
jgi:hypothetical protein